MRKRIVVLALMIVMTIGVSATVLANDGARANRGGGRCTDRATRVEACLQDCPEFAYGLCERECLNQGGRGQRRGNGGMRRGNGSCSAM